MQQPSLLDILTHTPSWVWAVLVLVLWIGLRRTRDRDGVSDVEAGSATTGGGVAGQGCGWSSSGKGVRS